VTAPPPFCQLGAAASRGAAGAHSGVPRAPRRRQPSSARAHAPAPRAQPRELQGEAHHPGGRLRGRRGCGPCAAAAGRRGGALQGAQARTRAAEAARDLWIPAACTAGMTCERPMTPCAPQACLFLCLRAWQVCNTTNKTRLCKQTRRAEQHRGPDTGHSHASAACTRPPVRIRLLPCRRVSLVGQAALAPAGREGAARRAGGHRDPDQRQPA